MARKGKNKKPIKVLLVWWELPSRIPITSATETFKILYPRHKTHTPFIKAAKALGWGTASSKGVWVFHKGTTSCILENGSLRLVGGAKAEAEKLYAKAVKYASQTTPKALSTAISRAVRINLYGLLLKNRTSFYVIPPLDISGAQEDYDTLKQEVETVGSWYELEVDIDQSKFPEVLTKAIIAEKQVIEDNYGGNVYKELKEAWKKKAKIFADLCDLDMNLLDQIDSLT